ncbi:MAG: hypothetical protein A2X42_04310 [Candidatus Margulisbacteria bacterium GWF2_38_17]|nr:MAG: hypothetical protein A2X43_11785 [Candidatus Margulisbacteria bacterium GWD2_39_127]OGI01862.1 MAG: hypothetical protein A2X42_04310 [Candidatus Margulisbacteria bacterium GWF2_38_17]OGI10184.1 MAG: hypothetical protein A2X41_01030 [Candidatus Margulisbacteria bacterium GWE2_39_32]
MEKILFVDDDQNLLDSYCRSLRKNLVIDIALGGTTALELINKRGPYAVIVSDYAMPEMNGIQFLSQAKELSPDSVRIMLTGNADQQIAIDAVNEGNIFRFLNKPCGHELLLKVLLAGLQQYRLIIAERELLEKTLRGSIKVLSDILAIINPEAFGMASRIRRYVLEISKQLGIPDIWKIETAAMLSQIGCVVVAEDLIKKYASGVPLIAREQEIIDRHPALAAELLVSIPRMQDIAEIIEYQSKHYDGTGIPVDSRKGEDIPLGARLLKVAIDYDRLISSGKSEKNAVNILKDRRHLYDIKIIESLEKILGIESKFITKNVSVNELIEHMIVAENIYTRNNMLLIARGQEISRSIMERLRYYGNTGKIDQQVNVIIPTNR